MDENFILELLPNGGISTVCIFGVVIVSKYFYQYVKEKDIEKNNDKKEMQEIYQEVINKYISREEKYISIINNFTPELCGIKQEISDMKNILKTGGTKNA